MLTKAKLRRVVLDLGSTPDDIASFLEGQGIKGIRHYEEVCPVANYLHAVFGTTASVDLWTIAVSNSKFAATAGKFRFIGAAIIKTPKVVQRFIQLFDNGAYKKLIKKV